MEVYLAANVAAKVSRDMRKDVYKKVELFSNAKFDKFSTASLISIRQTILIKKSQGFFVAQQVSLGKLNGQVEEMYGGHNVIRAFNKQADSIHDFEEINEELCDSAWKSQFFSSIMQPMMQFIGNLGYVVVCILGGYLAVKSVVDIGDIQAFIQYMRNFTSPIAQLASISNTLQ